MPGIYDTNNGYYQFVDKARAFACSVYRNIPGALVPNPSDAGYKQIWDNLCYTPPPAETPGLPPKPEPPFKGGQCCNLTYRVKIRATNDGGQTYFEVLLQGYYTGVILGVKQIKVSGGVGIRINHELQWRDCAGEVRSENVGQSNDDGMVQIFVKEVFVDNGAPDVCGDPPEKFPSVPPPPPEGYNSPPIVIIQNDGDINYYIFNFSPPQKEDYPDTSFPPITISGAGQDNSSYLEMKFNFDGSVDIDKPPLPEVKLPPSIQKKIDDTNSIVGGGGALEIKQVFDVDPAVKKRNTGNISEVQEDESGLLGIKVTLTNIPDKTHFGAPSVYFAGWITFKLQNGYAPRQQINFIESFFLAPPGATGYGCTFTNKAEGTVKVYSREAK